MDFTLRNWKLTDAKTISVYANNKKIADNLRDAFPYPYTLNDAEAYIRSSLDNHNALQFAIDINGEAAGSIGAFPQNDVYRRSAEIGYWLAEKYWSNGIISKSINRICDIVFDTTDIIRIFAEPYAHNQASRRALEKAGFVLEGILGKSVYKNGNIYDSCIYARLK